MSGNNNRNLSYRILADGRYLSNDTWATGINNNDLVIGPSGAGKTRSYVKPNIMQCSGSMVIADTKGNLVDEMGQMLEDNGYRVLCIDFKTMNSTCRYNPLEYLRLDARTGRYASGDIRKLVSLLSAVKTDDDPFWSESAKVYMELLITYVCEKLPEEEHTLEYVEKLFTLMDTPEYRSLMENAVRQDPGGTIAQLYRQISANAASEKTHASIRSFVTADLQPLVLDSALAMYSHPNAFRFRDLAKQKTALFLNISDTDRSQDVLISLLYSQALQDLCDYADLECPGQRLPIPVRFFLDDFATNCRIMDFDRIISVIRSREIYVSIMIQSLSQLEAIYGESKAETIVDNCDTLLYLGGQSLKTAEYIGERMDRSTYDILQMPLDSACLFIRGRRPEIVKKFSIESHLRYRELAEGRQDEDVSALR